MDKKENVSNQPSVDSNHSQDGKKEKEKKYVFYRKPSLKKKGPEVKQTKTSLKRLLIANPLLKYQQEGLIPLNEKPTETAGAVDLGKPHTITSEENNKNSNKVVNNTRRRINSIITANSSDNRSNISISNACRKSDVDFNSAIHKVSSSTPFNGNTASAPDKRLSILEQSKTRDAKVEGKRIRRSISAQHFLRKNAPSKPDQSKPIPKSRLSRSAENLNHLPVPISHGVMNHDISPILERSRETSFVFKTPSAYDRRSLISTPLSVAGNRRSIYRPVTPLPSLNDLQKRLNDWLTKRGKSLASFHNLTRFKPFVPIDEENKENVEGAGPLDLGSYEDLRIPQCSTNNENKLLKDEEIESVAKAALLELQKLVQNGFPVNQCEGWLSLIREKYSELTEAPEYWECRAAIEESRGNLSSAVECYKTAIVHGAEVTVVDKSLDVLLQKFSLLDINSDGVEAEHVTKERARIIRDARNVFKSSIIRFAVQEKKLKGDQTRLVATPVRRSTRLSRSAYTLTPGVKMCSSLRELDSPERSQVSFQRNKALD